MKPVDAFAPAVTALSTLLMTGAALAHTGVAGLDGGLLDGFVHPMLGWDHLVAMVAVGLWGAFLGAPALWLLPIVFPLVMALGGAAGVAAMPLPGVEIGIAASAIVLGFMVLLKQRPPLSIAALLVAVFAIFHGYAHGVELPAASNPMAFGAGFMVATGLLHLSGIGVGTLVRWPIGVKVVQALGAAIALTGLAFLVRAL